MRLELQTDSIDDELRSGIWSVLVETILEYEYTNDYSYRRVKKFGLIAYRDFFKIPIDQLPTDAADLLKNIRKWFFESAWYEVYDFLEHCWQFSEINYKGTPLQREFLDTLDEILEREKSGFRLVAGHFIPITSEFELDAVESIASRSDRFRGGAEHIKTAISHYSNRAAPDYRNAVKEAISAVESVARVLSSNERATLGDALKILDKNHRVHPALREGLNKIYGYTSDEAGIRHSLLEDSLVDNVDALFMIVTCSAFCNYLIERCKIL